MPGIGLPPRTLLCSSLRCTVCSLQPRMAASSCRVAPGRSRRAPSTSSLVTGTRLRETESACMRGISWSTKHSMSAMLTTMNPPGLTTRACCPTTSATIERHPSKSRSRSYDLPTKYGGDQKLRSTLAAGIWRITSRASPHMMRHGIRPPPPPALALPSESPAPPPATGGRRAGRLKRLAAARGGRGEGEPPGCAGGGSGPQRRWQACEAANANALRRPARRTPRLATKVEAGRAPPGSGARSLPAAPTCSRQERPAKQGASLSAGAGPRCACARSPAVLRWRGRGKLPVGCEISGLALSVAERSAGWATPVVMSRTRALAAGPNGRL